MTDKKPTQEQLAKLSEIQYKVTQEDFTEAPFSGVYDDFYEKGIYVDIVDGTALFSSTHKYDAGCGWPAFSKPIDNNLMQEKLDLSRGRVRTEVRSANANSHLGHVFDDGPAQLGGMRYCINSAALRFIKYEDLDKEGYSDYKILFDEN